jgi:hypothetical protein
MAEPRTGTPSERRSGRQLVGWKEIANHFGKGVRTVQRWEADLSLPVRRLKTGRGETVYALAAELDAWRSKLEVRHLADGWDRDEGVSTSGNGAWAASRKNGQPNSAKDATADDRGPASAEAGRRRWRSPGKWRLASTAALVLVVAVAALLFVPRREQAARNPADYRVRPHSLEVLDATGRSLWAHEFERTLVPEAYGIQDGTLRPNANGGVIISDLDGDGTTEVLFVARTAELEDRRLYCFGHDGRVRFIGRVPSVARFGAQVFEGGFFAERVQVTRDSRGTSHIWVTILHHPYFPSALAHLDTAGTERGTYWSNGHITAVEGARLQARDVILVGACNNELKASSLAILDVEHSAAAAPAAASEYQCRDCPPSAPAVFLVFPSAPRFWPLGAAQRVSEITVRPTGFEVLIEARPNLGGVRYRFSSDLVHVDAGLVDGYMMSFATAVRAGVLPQAGPFDPKEIWPVRRWSGAGYTELDNRVR